MPTEQNRPQRGLQDLPPWFERPRSAEIQQGSLFPDELHSALATLQVSADELLRWHEREWVSFSAGDKAHLEKWEVDEIQFVRDVARSGLSDALVDALLAQLPRPLNFDPASVAYSFSLGWVMALTEPEPDPAKIVDEYVWAWMAGLAEEGDRSRLEVLRRQIEEFLESLPSTGSESRE